MQKAVRKATKARRKREKRKRDVEDCTQRAECRSRGEVREGSESADELSPLMTRRPSTLTESPEEADEAGDEESRIGELSVTSRRPLSHLHDD